MKYLVLAGMLAVALTACGKKEETAKPAAPAASVAVPAPASPWAPPADALALSPEVVAGKWKADGKDCEVKLVDGALVIVNEKGQPSKGKIEGGKVLVALDWNVKAALWADGKSLRWSDGSIWFR